MSTFILRLDGAGSGPRLAVKDLIDLAGLPTTAGSRALERRAKPAERDAPCMAGARAADARIVGKVNLHELAMLPLGTNPWFGTPQNPFDAALIPGGSSSGSAVAVATDEADIAYGSDTGGSVRIPAACCGVAGLKTTHGRISIEGVCPLAPSLDTIGPLARDVAGLVTGMQLLEPGFTVDADAAVRIGRVRSPADPDIDNAVDEALRAAGFEVVPVEVDWELGSNSFLSIYAKEVLEVDLQLVRDNPDDVGEDITGMIATAEFLAPALEEARSQVPAWQASLDRLFDDVQLLALPTLPVRPPRIDDIPADPTELVIELTRHVSPFNAAGVPATAQPVPMAGSSLPASLELVGPRGAEALLLATAAVVESAVRR
ncbi:MAG TPA: amidase [Mycobacteriales bacterium]|nr:amidase [Mycobacteriales bacterium]